MPSPRSCLLLDLIRGEAQRHVLTPETLLYGARSF